jgi:hypothetical protein
MNITLFGASGRTGLILLKLALQQDHHVTAYVRQTSRIPLRHQNLQVIEGNLKNVDLLRKALAGNDAVISTLGVSKTLQHDPEVVQGISNIVEAMAKEDVPHFVYQSVFLAGSQSDEFSPFVRKILKRVIRKEVEDHQVKEEIIRDGVEDYTIVRPVRLTNGCFSGKLYHGISITSSEFIPSISRADVAHFMLQQLADRTYRNKSVRLMKTKVEKK